MTPLLNLSQIFTISPLIIANTQLLTLGQTGIQVFYIYLSNSQVNMGGRYYYYLHFTDEKIKETLNGLRSRSWYGGTGLQPRQLAPASWLLTPLPDHLPPKDTFQCSLLKFSLTYDLLRMYS